MHEELVKRLRAECTLPYSVIKDMRDAADTIEGLEKAYQMMAEAYEIEATKERWVPVSEQLPKEEKKMYWVCLDTGYQCECRWTNNRFGISELDEWGWSIFDIPQYQNVVAWMPLPEPYKPPKEET